MKNLLMIFLSLVLLAAACKKDKIVDPPPSAPVDSLLKGTRFTNTLPVRVILDIYDTANVCLNPTDSLCYYARRFFFHKYKLQLIINPNTTIVLPKDSLLQGSKYYYDWYTDSMDISSWHQMPGTLMQSMIADYNSVKPYTADSFFYRLSFRQDSTTQGVNISIGGKPVKWRRIIGRRSFWDTAGIYDSMGQPVSYTLPSYVLKNLIISSSYCETGVSGVDIFRFSDTTTYERLDVIDFYHKFAGSISQSFSFAGLSTTSGDTLFVTHTEPHYGGYIYKMYCSSRTW